MKTLLSTIQAAEYLKLTRRRVQKFCEEGRLGQRVGGRYVISVDELRRFKKKRPTSTNAKKPKSHNGNDF